MTLRELVVLVDRHPVELVVALISPLVIAMLLSFTVGRERAGSSWIRYFYAAIVYWVSIPGTLAAVLTAYVLFLTRESLLDVSLLVYVTPIVAMTTTLAFVARGVDLDRVPGFDRLSGLLMMLAMSFVIVLAIVKTRIFLFFGGSLAALGAAAAFVFGLLKWGFHAAFRPSDEAKPGRPDLPRFD